ncbi:hypothetical protein V5O48_012969 [Marasmius crinis-equi]|uniref:Kinetochore protein Sos7 coiled-coil domain-containing protein n=1 Tax=Marasmius crinis-equi TaxID=585013 RepID=A0ABR3F1E3_9AGAR
MDSEKDLCNAAQILRTSFESSNLHVTRNASSINAHKLDTEDTDVEEAEGKDPAIIAMEVEAQLKYLRKLKFQFVEQNAKDKYVTRIVSDIEDVPLVTDEDNKQLKLRNEGKKEVLKQAKQRLEDVQAKVRSLAPMVEEEYVRVQQSTDKAVELRQKIIDARLALSRLRQLHPHPRLTIQTADQKLADQVVEMQDITDEIETVSKKVQEVKERLKSGALEMESLRAKRAEAEKNVKIARVDEDDSRLVPLYDWFTASLALHRSMQSLENMEMISQNEIRLRYRIDNPRVQGALVTITLIFVPDSRQLAAADVVGLDELGVDPGDVVEAHIQMNNVQGLLSAILSRARAGV